MLNLLRTLLLAGLAFVRTRRQLAVEILALRHQLGVLKRSVKRPRLSNVYRGLWVLLSRWWSSWSDALIVVKPATVIRWHRAGFRRYWTWRSRSKGGRPAIDPEVRELIKQTGISICGGEAAIDVEVGDDVDPPRHQSHHDPDRGQQHQAENLKQGVNNR